MIFFFLFLLDICPSFEKSLFSSFACLLVDLLIFGIKFFKFFSIVQISSVRRVAGKAFLTLCRVSLQPVVSLALQKLLNLIQSYLLIVISCAISGILFRKRVSMASSVSLCFLLEVSEFHFVLIFVQGEKLGSSFLLQKDIQFSQHHLLKRFSFLQYLF